MPDGPFLAPWVKRNLRFNPRQGHFTLAVPDSQNRVYPSTWPSNVVRNAIDIHHMVMDQDLTHLRTTLPSEVHSFAAEFNSSPTCRAKLCTQNPDTGVVSKPQHPVTFKDIDLRPMFQAQAVNSATTPAAESMGVRTSTDVGLRRQLDRVLDMLIGEKEMQFAKAKRGEYFAMARRPRKNRSERGTQSASQSTSRSASGSQTPFNPNNGWAPVPPTSPAPLTSNPELNALLSQGMEDFANRARTLAPATAPVASATPAQAPVVGTQTHATPQHPVVPTNAAQPIAQTVAHQHPAPMDGVSTGVAAMEVDQDVVMMGTPLLDATPVHELAAISLEDRPVVDTSLVLSHPSVNQPQHPSANRAQQPSVSQPAVPPVPALDPVGPAQLLQQSMLPPLPESPLLSPSSPAPVASAQVAAEHSQASSTTSRPSITPTATPTSVTTATEKSQAARDSTTATEGAQSRLKPGYRIPRTKTKKAPTGKKKGRKDGQTVDEFLNDEDAEGEPDMEMVEVTN
ncbi:hypothetical protein FA13DRAFT_1712341 [Coprinellus micaceus]|uniref:Uncharacterized protein n=1 Tax=Coprinellus micaceus TaxID=71717 RepID=A0A4Y7T0Z1_COPMI|nr:hypothetical protein FA13DRAFT_1712341 [Coprinellus micaceus]